MATGKMKVGTRLTLGFGLVIALLAIIAGLALADMNRLNHDIDGIVNDKFPKTVLANDMIDSLNVIARAVRNVLLVTDKKTIDKELARVPEQRKVIDERIKSLEGMVRSDEGKALLKTIIDARAPYLEVQDRFLKLVARVRERARVQLDKIGADIGGRADLSRIGINEQADNDARLLQSRDGTRE